MENKAQSEQPPELEEQYELLKKRLYTQFFKGFMIIVLALIANEMCRIIFFSRQSSIFPLLANMCVLALAIGFFTVMEKYKEKIMTIFFFCHYLFTMIRMYKGADGYFKESINAYYVGCNMTIYENIIVGRIPRFDYQILFSIATTTVRLYLLPPHDITPLVFHLFLITAKLLLERHREIHNKNLFRIYFNSKEQLVKFKNLVVHDFPQGIAILHKNLDRYLFSNDIFKDMNKNFHQADIRYQLTQFVLKQSADGVESDTSNSGSSQGETTLLTLIKRTFYGHHISKVQKITCTVDLKTPDGSQKGGPNIFGVNVMDIIWDDEPAIAIIARDVTQQHKIMSLKIADAQKDLVLATVSHELRTPLNGILGMIQIMEKKIYDAELKNYLAICKNSGTLLLSLVNSILDINQIRANKLKLCFEKIDVYKLLMSIISLFEFQCSKKGIYLKIKMHVTTPKSIVTDKNRLSQILINLVGNALKFTSSGGITIIANKSLKYENGINFSVEDTGIGIKEEDKEKLFKVFGKLENDDGVNKQGVGLGLNISKNLVMALCEKGHSKGIKVESEYGKGSCFSFMISNKKRQNCSASEEENDLMINQQQFQESNAQDINNNDTSISNKISSYSFQNKLGSDVFDKSSFKRPKLNGLTHLNTTSVIPSFSRSRNPFEDSNDDSRVLKTDRGLEISRFYTQEAPDSLKETHINKPYVLVVDDNPFNVTVAEHMITALGYQIKSALSGEAAISLLVGNNHKNYPIKIIFMDCHMPVMDGYETTKVLIEKMLKEEIPNIPVIALTANDCEKDKEKCKKVGMCDYLTKPLNEPNLKKIIWKYMK